MKLCRIGNIGNEKPALIDNENNYRDLSSLLDDFLNSPRVYKPSALISTLSVAIFSIKVAF